MTPNDKLPETMQDNIKADAQRYTKDEGYQRSYIAGATAWASKLLQMQFDYKNLNQAHKAVKDDLKNIMTENNELKDALQEFVSNHEAGLLPNRFVYEKAIKILNYGK